MKFKEIVPQFMEYKANYVKRSTMSAYMLLCQNHVLPDFGECESITEEFIQDFVLRKINSGLSQKTVVDILVVVKMILKYAAKRKLFEYQMWEIIYPTEQKNHKIEVLTKSDHKKVLHHIIENFSFKNLGIFICLSTGMRIGEICALRWEDLDIETGIISIGRTIQRIYTVGEGEGKGKTEVVIDNPKTKCSNREIPMSVDLLKMIKPIKKIVNDSYYLLTNDKKPTEPRTYRSYYHEFMKGIEMPVIKFHSLRHTFATRCIESGCDIKTTSVILGHSNVSTTLNIYVHPNNDQKKKAIDHMFKAMK